MKFYISKHSFDLVNARGAASIPVYKTPQGEGDFTIYAGNSVEELINMSDELVRKNDQLQAEKEELISGINEVKSWMHEDSDLYKKLDVLTQETLTKTKR